MAKITLLNAVETTGAGTGFDVGLSPHLGVQIIISDSATVRLEGSIDGTNYSNISRDSFGNSINNGFSTSALFAIDIPLRYIRAFVTSRSSGTITVIITDARS